MPAEITERASTSNVWRALDAIWLVTAWHLGCEQSTLSTSAVCRKTIFFLCSVYLLESLRMCSKITNTQPAQSTRKLGSRDEVKGMTSEQFSNATFRLCGWID